MLRPIDEHSRRERSPPTYTRLTSPLVSPPASSMPLGVGSSATKSSSQLPMREYRHYPSPRHHPYHRYQGSSTSDRETRSRRNTLLANAEGHYFPATVGDLGVARPNEDSLEYAARVAAGGAKAEDDGGTSKFQEGSPENLHLI